jgi:hypothetical protein
MSDIDPQFFLESPLLKSLEQIFEERAPEWKRETASYSENEVASEWVNGDSKAIVQIARMASPEEVSTHLQLFAWHIPLTDSDFEEVMRDPDHYQLPQPVMPDAKLPSFDNENYVWTRYNEHGSSLIKLKVGNLFVQVDGSSFAVAERFARIVAEHLRLT